MSKKWSSFHENSSRENIYIQETLLKNSITIECSLWFWIHMWKKRETKGKNTEKIFYQKPVSICYNNKSDLEKILQSGYYQNFGEVCKKWFVQEMQELKLKMYKFLKKRI